MKYTFFYNLPFFYYLTNSEMIPEKNYIQILRSFLFMPSSIKFLILTEAVRNKTTIFCASYFNNIYV